MSSNGNATTSSGTGGGRLAAQKARIHLYETSSSAADILENMNHDDNEDDSDAAGSHHHDYQQESDVDEGVEEYDDEDAIVDMEKKSGKKVETKFKIKVDTNNRIMCLGGIIIDNN